jgi:hypothetical protein
MSWHAPVEAKVPAMMTSASRTTGTRATQRWFRLRSLLAIAPNFVNHPGCQLQCILIGEFGSRPQTIQGSESFTNHLFHDVRVATTASRGSNAYLAKESLV